MERVKTVVRKTLCGGCTVGYRARFLYAAYANIAACVRFGCFVFTKHLKVFSFNSIAHGYTCEADGSVACQDVLRLLTEHVKVRYNVHTFTWANSIQSSPLHAVSLRHAHVIQVVAYVRFFPTKLMFISSPSSWPPLS